jgi:phage terminase large subunit
MTSRTINIPQALVPVFAPRRGDVGYRAAYGGRGSGKSFTFAKMAAIFGYAEPLRILCAREFQKSIKESFHAELKNAIESEPWLSDFYDVGVDYLRGRNGTEFIFAGLRHNIASIKSMAQIDITIIEEAEDIPETSWIDLLPTVMRRDGSEVWVVWNPRRRGSPVDTRFIQSQPPRCVIAKVNYSDNKWFPRGLNEQRLDNLEKFEPELYAHIWEGAYLERTEALVFRAGYTVQEFEPVAEWGAPYFGLDFGFSADPTACVKCWIFDGTLYIEKEAGGVGVELDHTPALLLSAMPEIQRATIRADNSRPESISYLRRNGLGSCRAVKKGKGSVEDGISHIKSYRVVIHPRCKETVKEFLSYSYKTDRLTGDVLTELRDENNHYIDALRYALEAVSKGSKMIMEAL